MNAPNNDTSPQQHLAVIAGGLGYVGMAIAERLAKDGFRIALLYRNRSALEGEAAVARLAGDGHAAYAADLASEQDVHAVFAQIIKDLGTPSVCIFAAGSMPRLKKFHLLTESDLREEFDANVFPAFNFLSASAQVLKAHAVKGVIIGITTAGVVSSVNTKARGPYSPVKFAQQGMLVALKEELAPAGIRVYSLAPGVMPGGLNRDTPKAFLDMVRETIPDKKLADAAAVAEVASYLCSDKSRDVADLTVLVAPESNAR